jgi:hypothetical protein
MVSEGWSGPPITPAQPGGGQFTAPASAVPAPPVPGAANFDHGPISNALEGQLQDWLNRPVQDILNQFHMGQLPNVSPHDMFPSGGIPADLSGASGLGGLGGGGGNNLIGGMLKPATDLLGTVGNGVFQGVNPSQFASSIGSAFQQAFSGLQSALGSMGQGAGSGGGWAGNTAGQMAQNAGQTLAHGAATMGQTAGLAGHYTTAAADSSQGYSRLIEAIQQGQDELSALAGGLPWTGANMVESANRTAARATAIVTELESTLTSEAGAAHATGAPVEAASQLPQMANGMMSTMMSLGSGMISPAMSVGMLPMSLGMSAMQAGMQAGTSLMSSVGKGAGGAGAGAGATLAGNTARLASAATHATGGGAGGGGLGATTQARAVPASPMIQRESAAAVTSASVTRPAVGASGMGGAGMGGAGMMGGGQHAGKAGSGGNHTTASFLHTTDQGGEIVGDLGSASPPVIGEADPNTDPDVKLQI